MTAKRIAIAAGTAGVVVLLTIGLLGLGGSSAPPPARMSLADVRSALAGSPAPLAALHAQSSQVLPGGLAAVRARLAALRGMPIVVNKWASWCEPCRAEFGVFQRVSTALGREVAFLGIDSGDSSRAAAVSFLRSFPVGYPSYYDPSGQAGAAITDSSFIPVTVFYDARGRQYIHQGPYPSVAKLQADVRRYALDG